MKKYKEKLYRMSVAKNYGAKNDIQVTINDLKEVIGTLIAYSHVPLAKKIRGNLEKQIPELTKLQDYVFKNL